MGDYVAEAAIRNSNPHALNNVSRRVPSPCRAATRRHSLLKYAPWSACAVLALAWSVAKMAQGADSPAAKAATQKQPETTFQLTSTAFDPDGAIPVKYTCDGANVSPALAWSDPPAGTQSFALIVDDPDAPQKTMAHWLIYSIPPATRALPEGTSKDGKLPDGSRQGKNDQGKVGYSGPCPPPGAVHHYFFKLYALDYNPNLKPKVKEADVVLALKDHVLAQSELIARFQR